MWNIIQIGTKYIELIVLSFIGYKGEYSNRLKERWFGEVEVVPWNKLDQIIYLRVYRYIIERMIKMIKFYGYSK